MTKLLSVLLLFLFRPLFLCKMLSRCCNPLPFPQHCDPQEDNQPTETLLQYEHPYVVFLRDNGLEIRKQNHQIKFRNHLIRANERVSLLISIMYTHIHTLATISKKIPPSSPATHKRHSHCQPSTLITYITAIRVCRVSRLIIVVSFTGDVLL
jgi:hypothetical protein